MPRTLGRKCPRAGVRVRHPGGDTGIVTKMTLPSGKVSTCTGPGKSDLVYVKWDSGAVLGVPKTSLERTKQKGGLGTLSDVWRMNPAGREAPPMAQGRVLVAQPGDYVVNNEALEPMRLPQYKTPDQLVNRLQDEWANEMGARVKQRRGVSGLGADGTHGTEQRGNGWRIWRSAGRPSVFSMWGLKPMSPREPLDHQTYDLYNRREGTPATWGLIFEMRRPGVVVVLGESQRNDNRGTVFFTSSEVPPEVLVNALSKEGRFTMQGLFWVGRDEPRLLLETTLSQEQREMLLVWLDEMQMKGGLSGVSGLGWDDTTHAQEFDKARFEAMQSASDAELALEQGQCRTAGALLDEAFTQYGFMKGNATTPEQMSTAIDIHKALAKVARPFDQRCVREEPVSETHARSMSMMRPGLAGKR